MDPDTTDAVIRTAADVSQELIDITWEMVEGWYLDDPIDWENVLDRVERSQLADGRGIDLGGQWDTPAIKKIQRAMREMKREATA